MYILLLVMFGYRSPLQGLLSAVCITLSLLVHEFGHALTARRLRHDPSIMLHGFGGLTARSRSGRDVEEAAIVAMGPAAGLALGLSVFVLWQTLARLSLISLMGSQIVYTLLYYCIVWNLLNLLPMWPLDGGQLLRLGTGRWLPAQLAARITHGVSLAVIVGLGVLAYQTGWFFSLLILAMLGMQNVQALQGRSTEQNAPRTNPLAAELVDNASAALKDGTYKEAARLAHQARAQEGMSPVLMERVWEILGVATEQLGEYEEALAYLKRAPANERVRQATRRCLEQLDQTDELSEFQKRWSNTTQAVHMERWLGFALAFIVLAIGVVWQFSLLDMLFR
jgi:stage IV sporulation protein FB